MRGREEGKKRIYVQHDRVVSCLVSMSLDLGSTEKA